MHTVRRLAAAVICLTLAASAAGAADVPATLRHLQDGSLWGEITLASGGVRQIQVEEMTADSVAVREVIGPLQMRPAVYPVAQIRAARELGVHRIPQRTAPYRGARSARLALGLELVVPGAGFFYAGDPHQGLAMLGFAALVGGTAVATGKDGAAGWLPFAAWAKAASLVQVHDQVTADNGAFRDRAGVSGAGRVRLPLVALRF